MKTNNPSGWRHVAPARMRNCLSGLVLCGGVLTASPVAVIASENLPVEYRMHGAVSGLALAQAQQTKDSGSEGRCSDNKDCMADFYCAKPVAHCQEAGECKKRPQICTHQYDPVCGCDANSYPNRCHAAAAGVNVDHKGACRGKRPVQE